LSQYTTQKTPDTIYTRCSKKVTLEFFAVFSGLAVLASSLSPLASSLTRSVFHSELKTWLFGKSFSPQTFSFPTGLILRTLGPFIVFILLNGWICLHCVLN